MTGEKSNSLKVARYFKELASNENNCKADILNLDDENFDGSKTEPLSKTPEWGKYVDQIAGYDLIVIASSLYNFNVTPRLLNWINHICLLNKTFKYTANGPVGILKLKVVIAYSRGGIYHANNSQVFTDEQFLNTLINGFLGWNIIGNFYFEGLNIKDSSGKNIYLLSDLLAKEKNNILELYKKI